MPTDADAQAALAELRALAKIKGRLKIITNERADKRATADLSKPSSFVLHDVVRVEPSPSKAGTYQAFSAEGDWTWGYPAALVRRLSEWREA